MTRTIPLVQARRTAVVAQQLASPRPTDVVETVRRLWMLQMDPTSAVARAEHLVLFSRLGASYRPAALERALWTDRTLFEYRAFILPVDDLPIHKATMRGYPPRTEYARHIWVRRFLEANASFRRHILRRLRDEGPLLTRDIEDQTALEWRTGGWNDGDGTVGMMLEMLWARGDVMIVGRRGGDRLWDLASRRLPMDEPVMPPAARAREVVRRQLAAAGIAKPARIGWLFDGLQADGWQRALAGLVKDGTAVEVAVEGVKGAWIADAAVLHAPFRGRSVALSPFDRLVHDRSRLEALWGFEYRLEIYVPKAKRRWGYYVLPVLRGERLVGRFDPRFERDTRTLRINAVHAEDDPRAGDAEAVRRSIDELARWLRATEVTFHGPMPSAWRRTLTT
ncbi:MAG TPA: crosslink repair DNA glycosylase YcaQ family protein [Actinomycetota bacterium]|nr:crosslink repair DNA glycosylase YcaQ family protein [Actinomycetota bacterium]